MDIGTVAKRSGVPASTLRFYEEKGLIASIGRHGLRRLFAPEVLERLALIALGRSAGFTLDEIGRMFGADGKPRIDRRLLTAKADELEARIRELEAMTSGLRHAATCPAPSHLECPSFRRLMGLAAAGELPVPRDARPARKGAGPTTASRASRTASPATSRRRARS